MKPDDEERFTVDDLIAHEKRQMRFVLVVLLLAVLYFAGRQLLSSEPVVEEPPALPVPSGARD